MDEFAHLIEQFPLYILVLIRTAGIIGFAPVFSHRAIPIRVKAALVFVLAFVILPGLPAGALGGLVLPDTILGWTFIVIKEFFVGVTLGFVATATMTGIIAAGEFASRDMGLAMAAEFNPDLQAPTTPLSELYIIIFTLLILVLNVHYWFIQSLVHTYEIVPINGFHINGGLTAKLTEILSWIYVIGVRISAPVMAVLFLMTTAIGIMSRAAPQVNILLISFPIRLAAGLIILGLSVHIIGRNFQDVLLKMRENMEAVMYLMT